MTAPLVELIYDQACPHVEACRQALREALRRVGADATWTEWDRHDARTPLAQRRHGSPTVLVNGQDVDGGGAVLSVANACRVYRDEEAGTLVGAPPVELVVRALLAARRS